MTELYACNGLYDVVHGETKHGCGTVFSPGTGLKDIEDREVTIEAAPGEDGLLEYDITDVYTFKGHCPVCDEEDVVLVEVSP